MAEIKSKQVKVDESSGRIMRGSQKIHVDHYKLLVAADVYNYAPTQVGDKAKIEMPVPKPQYTEREHVHFFHTYDSNGKKQTKSTSIAGHHHEITVIAQGVDQPPKIVCGPAVKEVRRKDPRTKEWVIGLAPADDDKFTIQECHVHEIMYLSSEEATIRDMNMRAIQLETREAKKGEGPGGVLA